MVIQGEEEDGSTGEDESADTSICRSRGFVDECVSRCHNQVRCSVLDVSRRRASASASSRGLFQAPALTRQCCLFDGVSLQANVPRGLASGHDCLMHQRPPDDPCVCIESVFRSLSLSLTCSLYGEREGRSQMSSARSPNEQLCQGRRDQPVASRRDECTTWASFFFTSQPAAIAVASRA